MGGVFISNIFTYAILPLELITEDKYKVLSSNEKILYTLLLNRVNYSKKNLKIFSDEKGVFVYYSNQQIQEHIGCSENTATKILNNLEKVGLIKKEYQKRGLPTKIYVTDIRNYNSKSYIPQSQVSFDIEKATQKSKENRINFGSKKNKRRTH